ncbi:MAG TPA: TolC family protein [Bryobacteraceae bacterium]|jgi:outer membrane protein|nr:TolC family protein [Bryobacteraceae bacterium]
MIPRKSLAIALCLASLTWAQDVPTIQPVRPEAPVIFRPYLPVTVPPVRLANSPRLLELVRAGALYLTAQDAIALALENNIDIEVGRYNPFISEWQLERAQAGGALPGVPSSASQAGSVATGQGVAGSQAAAGVSVPGASANVNKNSNATISQIGPVTQNLDPIFQETATFSHTSTPQPDLLQSQVLSLIQNTRGYTSGFQQGLLSGGIASVSYSEHYLNENAPTDVLNPTVAPSVSVSIQHNFLQGFGVAANARTITVSRMNLNTTDLNFRTQVIGIVSQVLNLYYTLAGDYEDLRAKQSASETAQAFLRDVNRQVEIGSSAPTDAITAQTQVATTNQAVVDSETALRQQELSLKNLISRTGAADPVLANVRIVPIDPIEIPPSDDLPPVSEMVKQALANRADLASELAGEKANEVSALGTKNGILPTLQGIGVESQAGLAGAPKTVTFDGFVEQSDPRFRGGLGNALSQVFQRDFATEIAAVFYQEPIRNRQAQADYAIDLLTLRQTQLGNRKDLNQVEVDLRNSVVTLQQARARFDAALQNRVLQQQLFEAEQKRFQLGASTPYNVAVQQRDLISAQSSAVAALVAYSTARVTLDQTLGATLDRNHISIGEVKTGRISRPSSLPASVPGLPASVPARP